MERYDDDDDEREVFEILTFKGKSAKILFFNKVFSTKK